MPWLPETGYAMEPLSRGPASGSLRPREVCARHSCRGVGTATLALAGLPGLIGLLSRAQKPGASLGAPQ